MKKVVSAILSFIIICLTLCSCEADIIKEIHNALDGEKWTYINGYQVPIPPEVDGYKKEDIIFKSTGETICDYVTYKYSKFDITEKNGINGLYYTLNKVTVYDSISTAGLSYDVTNGNRSKEILEKNPFVLVDITLTYKPTETATNPIAVSWSLYENTFSTKKYTIPPLTVYFSHHPEGKVDDFLSDGNNYFVYEISQNESIDVQIGINVSKECIDNSDIYLTPHPIGGEKLTGFTPECFKLIDEKTVFEEAISQ